MWSIREVLKVLARRMIPWTSYPLDSNNSARYEPSCPVIPVTTARFNVPLYWNRVLRRSPTIDIMRLCSRFNGQVSSIRQDPKNFFSGFPMQQPHETISSRRTPDSLDTMPLLTPSRYGSFLGLA